MAYAVPADCLIEHYLQDEKEAVRAAGWMRFGSKGRGEALRAVVMTVCSADTTVFQLSVVRQESSKTTAD